MTYLEEYIVGSSRVSYARTVTEADIVAHAGQTGDFYPHHVDAEFARTQPAGERIAHGTLILSMSVGMLAGDVNENAMSYGYDRVRFVRPVVIGDTIRARARIAAVRDHPRRPAAGIVEEHLEVTNQRAETVLALTKLYLVDRQPTPAVQQHIQEEQKMTPDFTPAAVVDAHQHLWMLSERAYDWIVPAYGPLHADFGPADVADDAATAGISGTVLVQAADTYEDTFYMLSVAAQEGRVKGVVGWVPLDRSDEAEAALDLYTLSPWIKGVRALTHTYEDPRWILRDDVTVSVSLLAARGLTLDYVCVTPEHLALVPELAQRHPDLKIVIDHLAKPDIKGKAWEPWATQLTAAATEPNVYIKISGLNTASDADWTAIDWQPYVDHAIDRFGADRVMLGSDWPVLILAGDFARVWKAQREVISSRSNAEQHAILSGTASAFYSLEL